MEKRLESDFLALATKGKNDAWRILLFIITLIALPTIAGATLDAIEFPDFDDKESELILNIVIEGVAFAIVLVGVYFAIKAIHKRSFRTLNSAGSFSTGEFFEGVAIWGLLIVLGSLINQQEQWKYFIDNGVNSSLIFIIPITLFSIGIQSYTEEVVFRGYLFQVLSLYINNKVLLILICSLLFGVLHSLAGGLAVIIGATVFGCMFCYIVLKRNNLAFVTGVHLINNFFTVYVLAERDSLENEDFWHFDPVEYAILAAQLLLLYMYITYRHQKARKLVGK